MNLTTWKIISIRTEKANLMELQNFLSRFIYFLQAVASKLHGVEVDIQIIKRKGEPIEPTIDIENNCKYIESQQVTSEMKNCTINTNDTNVNNNNIHQATEVPSNENSGSEYNKVIV